jgi:hypothetical protein
MRQAGCLGLQLTYFNLDYKTGNWILHDLPGSLIFQKGKKKWVWAKMEKQTWTQEWKEASEPGISRFQPSSDGRACNKLLDTSNKALF